MYKSSTYRNKSLFSNITLVLFCILIFYPPFFRGLFFERELFPTHIFSFLLLAGWLVQKLKDKDYSIITNYTDIFALGIVFMYFISSFYGVNQRLAIGELLKYSNYFFFYLLAKDFSTEEKNKLYILHALLFSALGVALVGIGSAVGTWNYNGAYVYDRINSTLQYPNALAAYMAAMFFLTTGFILKAQDKLWLFIYSALSTTFIFTLILTFSRGMWLIMPILVLLFILLLPKKEKVYGTVIILINTILGTIFASFFQMSLEASSQLKLWIIFLSMIIITILFSIALDKFRGFINKINYKILYAFIIVFVLLGGVLSFTVYNDLSKAGDNLETSEMSIVTQKALKVLPESITWRFTQVSNQKQNVEGRISFYKDAFKIIKDYPVFGAGGGAWSTLYFMYQSYFYHTTQAHNYFLQVWMEIGTLGIIIFALFIASIILAYYQNNKERKENNNVIMTSIFLAIMTFLSHSILDFDLSLSSLSIILWTLIGVLVSQHRKDNIIKFNKKIYLYSFTAISIILLLLSSSLYLGAYNANKAVKAYDNKDINATLRYFKKATKQDPFKASYKLDLGQVYSMLATKDRNALAPAKEYIDKAAELGNYDNKIVSKVAMFYIRIGQFENAAEYIDRLVELQPLNSENYQTKAHLYLSMINHLLDNKQNSKIKEYINTVINIENEFKEAASRSIKPMEMTEKTEEYINKAKDLKEKFSLK